MPKTSKSLDVSDSESDGRSQDQWFPNFLSEDTYEKTHAIVVDDPLKPNQPLIILSVLKGVTSYFLSRKPKQVSMRMSLFPIFI